MTQAWLFSRQGILAQNKRFLATPFGSFTALPLLCCMCLKGSRHSYTHAPCTESAVIALKQYLEVAWVYISQFATEEDLMNNHHLEMVGEIITQASFGVSYCPYCGIHLQSSNKKGAPGFKVQDFSK